MPWEDPPGIASSHTLWRAVIVVIAVVLALVIAGVVLLFTSNRNLITSNQALSASTRELACRVGGFFVGEPVQRQPGQSPAEFRRELAKAEAFLIALRDQDCTRIPGASITPGQIHHALRRLRRAGASAGPASLGPR